MLSTVEAEKTKCYNVNPDARFPIYIHSLKKMDGDKLLNKMNAKLKNNVEFTKKELLLISLLCFMDCEKSIENCILNSALTITNIDGLDYEIGQFAKGVILMLCDKFVEDESLNTTISNLVGGNMKIVEDYAQRKVDERNKEMIFDLQKEGYAIEDIARLARVSIEFVNETLAK